MLAIDPGTTHSGLCSISRNKLTAIDVSNETVLQYLRKLSSACGLVVIEEFAGQGLPVGASTFEACMWAGRFQQVALDGGADVLMVKRKTIVRYFTGGARGGDSKLRAALIGKYGGKGSTALPGPFNGVSGTDAWSAAALAIFGYEQTSKEEWRQHE